MDYEYREDKEIIDIREWFTYKPVNGYYESYSGLIGCMIENFDSFEVRHTDGKIHAYEIEEILPNEDGFVYKPVNPEIPSMIVIWNQ